MKDRVRKAFCTSLVGLIVFICAASAAAQIQVTSANPNNATQGTVNLNVTVNGNGFKKGAKAQWFISGTTTPGGVTVNSTTFNTSGQLTANITVAADAYIGQFDILVTNTDGRSGKGTELFAVNKKVTVTCAPDVTLQPVTLNICTTSGCLDPSFGGGTGMVTTQAYAPPYGENPTFIGVQGDGKIIAAGTADGWAIVRYNSDGTLDTSYASAGIGHYSPPPQSSGGSIADAALQSDGKLVAIGLRGISQIEVGRINVDGSLDTSFGANGFTAFPTGGRKDIPNARGIAVQSDGKILALGAYAGPWVLERFLPNGAVDTSFGTNGILTLSGIAYSVTLQQVGTDQRILVAGGLNGHTALWRYLPSGQLDSSFGYGGLGVASTNFCPNGDFAESVQIDAAGNLLVSGTVQLGPSTAPDNAIGIARFTPTGILDTTFGRTGRISYGLIAQDSQDGIGNPNSLIDSAGRLTLWGLEASPYQPWSVIFRVTPDGSLDSTFPGGQLVNFPYQDYGGLVHMIAQQPDGKLLFAGEASATSAFWSMRIVQ